jgi:uncharacterized protein YecE (DUF72 family)
MLEFYAQHLPAVELNNTFYRMPGPGAVQGWDKSTPDSFRFVMKAPRSITHSRKLLGCEEHLKRFVEVASGLGPKLGPLLFQLPPTFQRDLDRLANFLSALPSSIQAAFEFRHPSWFGDETYQLMRDHGVALCSAETADSGPPNLVATAPFGYVRLRREDYGPEDLAAWARALEAQPFEEVYVFFKHENQAPALARGLNSQFVDALPNVRNTPPQR